MQIPKWPEENFIPEICFVFGFREGKGCHQIRKNEEE
jgi:hypothetical protein